MEGKILIRIDEREGSESFGRSGESSGRGRKGEIARVTARPLYLRTGNRGVAQVGRGKFPIKGNPTLDAGRLRVRRPNNKAITIDDARTAIIRVYRHPRKRGYVTVWPVQLHRHPDPHPPLSLSLSLNPLPRVLRTRTRVRLYYEYLTRNCPGGDCCRTLVIINFSAGSFRGRQRW